MRIVSLFPAATEVVCSLGLSDDLVGVTHTCDWPPEVIQKPRVTRPVVDLSGLSSREVDRAVQDRQSTGGGLYDLDVRLLAELRPDLIITQGLCDVCAVSHGVVRQSVPSLPSQPRVLSLSPRHLADVLSTIKTVGDFTGRQPAARCLITELRTRLDQLALRTATVARVPRVVCLEWLDPPWAAGHWVPEMVGLAGGLECLGSAGLPARSLDWTEIVAVEPEAIVLMPCGFSLAATVGAAQTAAWPPEWEFLPAVRRGNLWAVDASGYFNRPGPRLFQGVEVLAAAFHPDALGQLAPARTLVRLA